MSETHSTPPAVPNKPAKPAKPYPEFPLTAHPAGYWCKRIRGKLHYFGRWADPDAALKKYLEQQEDLHAGRMTQADKDALTVKTLVNDYLNAKKSAVDAGELSPRTWTDYKVACDLVIKALGKERLVSDLGPADFTRLRNRIPATWGPHRRGATVQRIRCLFRHAYEAELIDRPLRFGPSFKRPTQKTMRLHRAKQGAKLFTADEIRKLLSAAGPAMKAMILLGINCGYGNSDCGNLPLAALDLENGWVDYPRPKTGVPRRCPLWPETVEAIRESLAHRPEPKDKADDGLVFITRFGLQRWAKDTASSPVSNETRKLMDALGINGHRNFYALRHTFRTIADEAKDQPAADYIMGHESSHMSTHYREGISEKRLLAVADYVRAWLFAEPKQAVKEGPAKSEEEEYSRR